ncbi:MAG: cobyrinate a,c-diamide synthase [Clostridia bacterium]|nr:cobyrinate a,c-diamide synthase [Clostridia bacterium]
MINSTPRVMISACSSGSGKTTVICGILMALKKRGINVHSCKCGPDYIDPMFHTSILGVPSNNLDSFFCSDELLAHLLFKHTYNSEITVIEGVMGYYDGLSMSTDKGSSYYIAKTLKTPVILVINAKGMALTIVSVIKGIVDYRKDSNIRGIILNNVSNKVYNELKDVIFNELLIDVIGYFPYTPECVIESRHLGLITPNNINNINEKLNKLGQIAEECIDISKLISIAEYAENLKIEYKNNEIIKKIVRIGVAKDDAFCFYYKDNLDLLESIGCEIVYFSPLRDTKLPENIDGIILGGGYPELYCKELSENKEMLSNVKENLKNGLPCLAECGGFMYLHKTMEDKNKNSHNMVGLIDGKAVYCGKLVRFGYITLTSNTDTYVLKKDEKIKAHEFHYWDSTNNGDTFTANKPLRNRSWQCMHQYKNVICGFPHIFYYSNPEFAIGFLNKCVEYKEY